MYRVALGAIMENMRRKDLEVVSHYVEKRKYTPMDFFILMHRIYAI